MRIRCIAVAGTALLVATLAGADERSDLRAIGEGRALYVTHCASCHGTDATGLTARSLTLIAQRDRTFDKLHVANHIRGRSDGLASSCSTRTRKSCSATAFRSISHRRRTPC